jgi:hypothetical protein
MSHAPVNSLSWWQQLLEDNRKLNEKYDNALLQHTQAMEAMEQECHQLRQDIKMESADKVCSDLSLSQQAISAFSMRS